jgi:nucleoside-diphosphate-sugar epimerase
MLDRIEDGSAVNLSTGILTSFTALAGMAAELAGWRPEIRGMSDRPDGVLARAGCTRLQESLGFRPRINLRQGIERALEHLAVLA